MITTFLALIASQGAMLVLDARPGSERCGAETEKEVVVCAGAALPKTRLPLEINGVLGTVLVEPGGSDDFHCNPAFVVRARMLGRGPYGIAQIGPIEVKGAFGEIVARVAGRRTRGFARWTTGPAVRDADCVVGPRGLGHKVVRFVLGEQRSDAISATFPFHSPDYGHVNAALDAGRHKLAVRFEMMRRRSVLTAPSARAIAPVLGGTAIGPVEQEEIAWNIQRPVRRLALHRSFRMGGLRLQDPYVRVADFGRAMNIRAVDPDEVAIDDVVVERRPGPVGRTKLVRVGADDLARCVSLTVDRNARTVTIVC